MITASKIDSIIDNLQTLNLEELSRVNSIVIGIIKARRAAQASVNRFTFNVGDQAIFPYKGRNVPVKIEEIKRSRATCSSPEWGYKRYMVSLGSLIRV